MMSHAENVPADFTGCVVCGYKESIYFEQYKSKLVKDKWYQTCGKIDGYKDFDNRYQFNTDSTGHFGGKYRSMRSFFQKDALLYAQEVGNISQYEQLNGVLLRMPLGYETYFALYVNGERQIQMTVRVSSSSTRNEDFYAMGAEICDALCSVAGQSNLKLEYFGGVWIRQTAFRDETPVVSPGKYGDTTLVISFDAPDKFRTVEGERAVYSIDNYWTFKARKPEKIYSIVLGLPAYVDGKMYIFKPTSEGTMFVYKLWQDPVSDSNKCKELTMLGLEDLSLAAELLASSDVFKKNA